MTPLKDLTKAALEEFDQLFISKQLADLHPMASPHDIKTWAVRWLQRTAQEVAALVPPPRKINGFCTHYHDDCHCLTARDCRKYNEARTATKLLHKQFFS